MVVVVVVAVVAVVAVVVSRGFYPCSLLKMSKRGFLSRSPRLFFGHACLL